MRKIFFSIIAIVLFFLGISTFISSRYFFNKYIATNIEEYGFSYSHVDGELFKGFTIESLKYKGNELSSNVEFKFNPFKLPRGLISIDRLHLIGVKKNVLERIVKDFSSNQGNESNTNINLNFEFNDIILTIKPFILDNINVKKANLAVDNIEYKNNKFRVGNLSQEIKSDIANIEFDGEFKHKILSVKKITIKELDLNRVITLIKNLKNDSNSSNNSDLLNSPFTPKIINLNSAVVKLKPFKLEGFSADDLSLKGSSVTFNVDKLLLINANLKLNYKNKNMDVKINTGFLNKKLIIKSFKANIDKPNILENSIRKLIKNNTESSSASADNNKILDLKRILIKKSSVSIKNYKYKDEKFDLLKLNLANFNLDENRSFKLSAMKLKVRSQLANITLEGRVSKNIILDRLSIKSNNANRIMKLFDNGTKESNSSSKISLPKNIVIKKLLIDSQKISFNPVVLNTLLINGSNLKLSNSLEFDSGNLKAEAASNFGKAKLSGIFKSNYFFAKGYYLPSQYLLTKYKVPLVAKNIKKMQIDGKFGFNDFSLKTTLNGKDILKTFNGFTIKSSKNNIKYNYNSGDLYWNIEANINSPYTKNAKLYNSLTYIDKSDSFSYKGTLKPEKSIFNDKGLSNLFNGLQLDFKGGYKTIDMKINSNKLTGVFKSDYNKGKLNLKNKAPLLLNSYINLGNNFSTAKANKVDIVSEVDFNKPLPLKGNVEFISNLVGIKGNFTYEKDFKSDFKLTLPRNSLLIKENKNLIFSNIKEFNSIATIDSKRVLLGIKNSSIKGNIEYLIKDDKLKSILNIGSLSIHLDGSTNNLNIKSNINSVKKAISSIKKIYNVNNEINIDGRAFLSANVLNSSIIKFKLTSPEIIYKEREKDTKISNIDLNGDYRKNRVTLNNYMFIIKGYKIYSNRATDIDFSNGNIIKVNNLWVNDSLNLNGNYNININKGYFKVKAPSFKLENKDAKINLSIYGDLKLIKKRKSFSGKINILNGLIKSTIVRKNLADNSDIIILQRKKAKESTNFAKNIKLDLSINSSKAIIYSGDGGYFKLSPKLIIRKEYNSLSKFIGKVYLKKGSYYKLNNKKLELTKGVIVFNGKSSSPNLNIEMNYKGRDYNIKISISGTPTRPILFFSSNPPLTKEQILAYLLFDDTSAVGTHSQDAMLNIIGGSLAKSLLGSIGIKIDHISVKQNGFSIGKNVSKNIMIYYNQDKDKASIKTRIDINKHIRTEIELGKEKQSADIIFTKEY